MPFRLGWWCLRHVPQYAWRFYILDYSYLWASLVIPMVKNSLAMQETRFNPWVGKIPWRRKWLSTPVFLPGEFHGQKSLEGSQRVGHDWVTNNLQSTTFTKVTDLWVLLFLFIVFYCYFYLFIVYCLYIIVIIYYLLFYLLFLFIYSITIGEGNGNPLQYSCLENPVDRGAWSVAVHRVAKCRTRLKRLSMHACIGEGNGNPLQYSCLENPRNRAWWAADYGVSQSQTRLKWPSRSSSNYYHKIYLSKPQTDLCVLSVLLAHQESVRLLSHGI